jgi:hypothetical protein
MPLQSGYGAAVDISSRHATTLKQSASMVVVVDWIHVARWLGPTHAARSLDRSFAQSPSIVFAA